MSKTKTLKVGDKIKITKSSWGYDTYEAKEVRSGDTVYTVEIKKIEKVKLTLE